MFNLLFQYSNQASNHITTVTTTDTHSRHALFITTPKRANLKVVQKKKSCTSFSIFRRLTTLPLLLLVTPEAQQGTEGAPTALRTIAIEIDGSRRARGTAWNVSVARWKIDAGNSITIEQQTCARRKVVWSELAKLPRRRFFFF